MQKENDLLLTMIRKAIDASLFIKLVKVNRWQRKTAQVRYCLWARFAQVRYCLWARCFLAQATYCPWSMKHKWHKLEVLLCIITRQISVEEHSADNHIKNCVDKVNLGGVHTYQPDRF